MQTVTPPFVEDATPPQDSEPEVGQTPVPPPTAGRKLPRKVVKPAAAPAEPAPPLAVPENTPAVNSPPLAPPPVPTPVSTAEAWQLATSFGPGLEVNSAGDRTRCTLNLVRRNPATGDNPFVRRVAEERQALRGRLGERMKAHLEATDVYRAFVAVRDQLHDHRQAAQLARATLEELAARRKRLELSTESNLAEQLRDVADASEDARAALTEAEQSATVLEPLVAQRRTAVEHESRRVVEPAIGEFRNEMKRRQGQALAALIANGAALDELAVTDVLLRSLSSGFFTIGDLAEGVIGER